MIAGESIDHNTTNPQPPLIYPLSTLPSHPNMMKKASGHRKRHLPPGPSGVWFQTHQQLTSTKTTETGTSSSSIPKRSQLRKDNSDTEKPPLEDVSFSPAWTCMQQSLNICTPCIPSWKTAQERYQLLRKYVSAEYVLFHEILNGDYDFSIPEPHRLLVMVHSVESHHTIWTVDLQDESGVIVRAWMEPKYIQQQLQQQGASTIRPGVVWMLKGVSIMAAQNEQEERLERMLLISEKNVERIWTPEQAKQQDSPRAQREFLNWMEKRRAIASLAFPEEEERDIEEHPHEADAPAVEGETTARAEVQEEDEEAELDAGVNWNQLLETDCDSTIPSPQRPRESSAPSGISETSTLIASQRTNTLSNVSQRLFPSNTAAGRSEASTLTVSQQTATMSNTFALPSASKNATDSQVKHTMDDIVTQQRQGRNQTHSGGMDTNSQETASMSNPFALPSDNTVSGTPLNATCDDIVTQEALPKSSANNDNVPRLDGAESQKENAFEAFAAGSSKTNKPLAQDSSRKRTEKDSSTSSGSKEKRTKQHRGEPERSSRSLSQQPSNIWNLQDGSVLDMLDEDDNKSKETKAQDPIITPKVSREPSQKERSTARSLSQQPSNLWNVQDDSILDMLDEDEEIAENESTPPAKGNVTNEEQPPEEKDPATYQSSKSTSAPTDMKHTSSLFEASNFESLDMDDLWDE
jgi:hypothetical protein